MIVTSDDLLMMDDFGVQYGSDWVISRFDSLIEYRYSRREGKLRGMIVTSDDLKALQAELLPAYRDLAVAMAGAVVAEAVQMGEMPMEEDAHIAAYEVNGAWVELMNKLDRLIKLKARLLRAEGSVLLTDGAYRYSPVEPEQREGEA